MSAKLVIPPSQLSSEFLRVNLDELYRRRDVVDELIRSLEMYIRVTRMLVMRKPRLTGR